MPKPIRVETHEKDARDGRIGIRIITTSLRFQLSVEEAHELQYDITVALYQALKLHYQKTEHA